MCHSNIMFHMHRAIKQMADVWNAKCQQRAICIATTGRGKGALLMHYLCYARWLCTNFVPQGIRRLLLICPLGKAINQSCRGNAGWTTYNSFQTKIPEFWMKLLWHTHISNMYILFFVENYIHLPCSRPGWTYMIRTKMNHSIQRTNKKFHATICLMQKTKEALPGRTWCGRLDHCTTTVAFHCLLVTCHPSTTPTSPQCLLEYLKNSPFFSLQNIFISFAALTSILGAP